MASRLGRTLLHTACSVLVLLLAFVTAIHVEEYAFRRRAEKLLNDLESLRVRHATFAEATDLFGGWRGSGSRSVPCDRNRCDLWINLNDFPEASGALVSWPVWESRTYRLAGARLAGVRAKIEVREGLVVSTDFRLDVDVPPFNGGDGRVVWYFLEGRAFTILRPDPGLLLYGDAHPDYYVDWPHCDTCVPVWVGYTPYATHDELLRVAGFNFSCVTRWQPCRTKSDIMPGAMALAASDEKQLETEPKLGCTVQAVQIAARESEYAAVVDVIQNRKDTQYGEARLLDVRSLDLLKGAGLASDSHSPLEVVDTFAVTPMKESSNARPGSRVIVLFDRIRNPRGAVHFLSEGCGVVPLDKQMFDVVRAGIAQDDLHVYLPYGPTMQYRDPDRVTN